MSFDYGKTVATATRLIKRFGSSRNYIAYTKTGTNYATGQPIVAETPYSLVTVKSGFTVMEMSSGAIETGDVKLLASVGTTAPSIGDTVTLVDGVYGIVNVEPIMPADTVILYIMQARR